MSESNAQQESDAQIRKTVDNAIHAHITASIENAHAALKLLGVERAEPAAQLPTAGLHDIDYWLEVIGHERQRQVVIEGFGRLRDDQYVSGQLADAALSYVMSAARQVKGNVADDAELRAYLLEHIWPWSAEWFKPRSPKADLIRAAALIIAELERLDRAEVKSAIAAATQSPA